MIQISRDMIGGVFLGNSEGGDQEDREEAIGQARSEHRAFGQAPVGSGDRDRVRQCRDLLTGFNPQSPNVT